MKLDLRPCLLSGVSYCLWNIELIASSVITTFVDVNKHLIVQSQEVNNFCYIWYLIKALLYKYPKLQLLYRF